jgi:NAD+ kinase
VTLTGKSFPSVGVISKDDPRVAQTVSALREHLHRLGCTTLADSQVTQRQDLAGRCELIIVVGGDGTLLSAARDFAPLGLPILGINLGRLGFMVDVHPREMEQILSEVIGGEYDAEERLMLSARVIRADGSQSGPFLAVNDAVIRNQAAIRMLEFETWLDRQFISQHRADGFIVSSPTGSTAYALSTGGPVLYPSLAAIALVPICPHTLSDRPIVVGADRSVRIVLRGAAESSAMFTCDGQTTETISSGDSVEVSRAPMPLRLIHPKNYNYFQILRNKLHWGRKPDTT